MSHVIIEKCLGEQYAACVDVCPVDCIHPIEHEGKPFMIIDPEVCIDCGVCIPECPITAIVGTVEEAPEDGELNKKLTEDAKAWEEKNGKITPRPPNDPPRRPDNKLAN